MDQVKFFKGCLPQVLVVPFLNTLSRILADAFITCLLADALLSVYMLRR